MLNDAFLKLKNHRVGLAGKFIIMLSVVIISSQIVSSFIWYTNFYVQEKSGLESALENISRSAAYTASYYKKLPKPSRHLLLEQNRSMGGTRFFVSLNQKKLSMKPIDSSKRKGELLALISHAFNQEADVELNPHIDFVLRSELKAYNSKTKLDDIPGFYAKYTIEEGSEDQPILVMQIRFPAEGDDDISAGEWFFLATSLPSPYVSLNSQFWDSKKINYLFVSSFLILILTWLLVRKELQPIRALSKATKLMSQKMNAPILVEEGSGEMLNALRAFNNMNRKVKSYIRDRDVLFGAISHDLKTPLAVLKLRTEMLDNEYDRKKFEHTLAELEFMLNGALQCIKHTDIEEDLGWVNINLLLREFSDIYNREEDLIKIKTVIISPIFCKPIAIKRVFSNIIENGVKYGGRLCISINESADEIEMTFRDFGPGIPDQLREKVFEPYFRIKKEKQEGSGLGLSIVRQIVRSHNGEVKLQNHIEQGLIVVLTLPRDHQ